MSTEKEWLCWCGGGGGSGEGSARGRVNHASFSNTEKSNGIRKAFSGGPNEERSEAGFDDVKTETGRRRKREEAA